MPYLLAILLALLLVRPAQAHSGPYLIINGEVVLSYTLGRPQQSAFPVPEDVVVKTYRPGEELTMLVGALYLGLSEQDLPSATYRWAFGDGTSGEGQKVVKTYAQPGTYLIDMTVVLPHLANPEQYLTTVQLNITADPAYQPPVARFTADRYEIARGETIAFDAGRSEGEGLTFEWDFGDGERGEGKVVSHTYRNSDDYFTVVLKVTDPAGFNAYETQGFFRKSTLPISWIIGGVTVLLAAALLGLSRRKETARVDQNATKRHCR